MLRLKTNRPNIVVITGAESTGKSELALQLARNFGVPYFSEYAREYVQQLDRHYTFADIESIAAMQLAQMHLAYRFKAPYVFFDTWLIVSKVWMEEVYGYAPQWVDDALLTNPVKLWLLCDTDLPWEPDPLRENGGERRLILSDRYRQELEGRNFDYRIISGTGISRFTNALEAIEKQRL